MNPPLNENEEKKILDTISLDKEEAKVASVADKFLKIFEEMEGVLFKDQFGTAFLSIVLEGRRINFPVNSSQLKILLQKISWDRNLSTLGKEALQRIVALLEAKATFTGPRIELFNRVALHEGKFWYDLGEGKAIRFDEKVWVQQDSPILFRKAIHQSSQVEPKAGGDVRALLRFTSLKSRETECLLLVWVISCFVPEIPHPVLILHGEKGAAKSTTMRLIQSLIDPSELELLSFPKQDELIQQLYHHYCAFYDNLRKLREVEADILCRAVTGAGSTKRRLYTDDEDVIYKFRRCIAMNGINNVVETPDLLERSLLIEVDRIQSGVRKTEQTIKEDFEKVRAEILGGIFDVLSKAIGIHPTVHLESYPRMADFAQWGYAISEALGYGGSFFLKAYTDNIQKQNEEVVEADPVAFAVRKLLESGNPWLGTPTELLGTLADHWYEWRLDEKARPKGASPLGKRLREVKSNLEDVGIKFEEWKDDYGRHYKFTKSPVCPVLPSGKPEPVPDGTDSRDSSLLALSDDQIRRALWSGAEIVTEPLKDE